MTMTKKDYELVATTIRGHFELEITELEKSRLIDLANSFAEALTSTNPLFNKEKFLQACGL